MVASQTVPRELRDWVGGQLFESVPSNIIVVDRNFRVVLGNSSFCSVFGEWRDRYCYEVYKRRDSACETCMAARTFADGQPRIHDESGFDKDGRPAHYVVHIVPVRDATGAVSFVIEMSYDVTQARVLQSRYSLLFERVPCYVWIIDRELRVVRANERVRQVFGDVIGEPCYRVYKHREQRCDDCPALKTFADGSSHVAKQRGSDKSGAQTSYVVSTAPLGGPGAPTEHVIEMALDVTEEEKLSADLLRESRFRHLLTETTLDALVATDARGVVTVFNPAAEHLFGVTAREVVGRALGEALLPAQFTERVQRGERNLILPDTQVTSASGERVPVRFSGTILQEGGEVVGSAGFFQDLREYKRIEQEKIENERLAAVGQTVAQLAHGMKNILTGIQGGMYALRTGMRKGSPERQEKGCAMLERNVGRITELVRAFLSYSKGHAPNVEEAQPREIAERVYHLYRDAAARRGIELVLEADDVPPALMDAEDMQACLENLVSNAIDACEVADTPQPVVRIQAHERDGTILFAVADNGCGMDYEIKNKVFTTFFTTKGLGGTGLGLLVTRKIVQEHGGVIHVSSDPGRGSVFTIELPRARLPQPAPTEQVPS